jgi:hypothetical protein
MLSILKSPHFWRGYRQGFLIGLVICGAAYCVWAWA